MFDGILFSAVVTFIALIWLWIKLSRDIRQKILRHPFASDATLSIAVVVLFGAMTATISGMIMSAWIGLFISAGLWLRRKVARHQKKIDGEWREVDGEWITKLKEMSK